MLETPAPLLGEQVLIVVAVFTQTLDDGPNKYPAEFLAFQGQQGKRQRLHRIMDSPAELYLDHLQK
jgi:hypothetical protein